MTTESIDIGATPCDEPCAQFGMEQYSLHALAECTAFINQIIRHYGTPPEGSRLAVIPNPYEGGIYYEVAVKYSDQAGFEYGLMVEHDEKNMLRNWDDNARKELHKAKRALATAESC